MSCHATRFTLGSLPATWLLCFLLCGADTAGADGVRDNNPDDVRRIPRAGIEVDAETRGEFERDLAALSSMIDELRERDEPLIARFLPDVIIFHRAVSDALVHGEFFADRDLAVARQKSLGCGRRGWWCWAMSLGSTTRYSRTDW